MSLGRLRRVRRLLALAPVLLVAVVIGACGGDDDSGGESGDSTTSGTTSAESTTAASTGSDAPPSDGGPITRDEFIELADAICLANNGQQDALRAELDAATSPEEAAVVYDELAALSEQAVADVTALPRPEGDEATIDRLVGLQSQGVALVRDLAAAVRANDQATGGDLIAQLQTLATEADAADAEFGFQVC